MLQISGEKRSYDELSDNTDEGPADNVRLGSVDDAEARTAPTKAAMEQEKRIRREIANSNERRRMQSINAGFQTLRSLLPRQQGDKLSKAAILQQTSDFIYSLEQEKTRLLTQNCQLKRLLGQQQTTSGTESDAAADSPASARRSLSQESVSEEARPGSAPVAPPSPAPAQLEQLRGQLLEVRTQLEQEQRLRQLLEERLLKAEQVTVKQELKFEDEVSAIQPELPSPRQQELVAPPAPVAGHAELPSPRIHELPSPMHHELISARHHELPAPHHQMASPKYHTLPSPQQEARSPLPQLHIPAASPQQALYERQPERHCAAPAPAPAAPHTHIHFKKQRLEIPSVEERLAPPVLPPVQLEERSEEVFVQHRPLYLSSTTSRQNLDTIVEAIRHLEGDHLFREMTETAPAPQEAPLELTTHARAQYQRPYHLPSPGRETEL